MNYKVTYWGAFAWRLYFLGTAWYHFTQKVHF